MARSRTHRRYGKQPKSNPAPRHNPPLLTDLVEFVVPGFGSFAGSRFLTRIATTQVEQRFPSWGKHAGAIAAAGTFLASWLLAHKVKWLEKWHTPIVVGSAIAGLQSVIQLYVPMLGWMVSDATPELAATAAANASQLTTMPAQYQQLQPTNLDPNEYTYDERYDAGRMTPVMRPHHGQGATGAQQQPGGSETGLPDLSPEDMAINDVVGSGANLGVFQN